MIDNFKGPVIYNDLVASVVQGYKDVWSEGWFKDLVNLASASRVKRLISLHLRPLLMHVKIFYLEVESCKNGDKFGWVKYWWMTFNLPKISSATILHYTIY